MKVSTTIAALAIFLTASAGLSQRLVKTGEEGQVQTEAKGGRWFKEGKKDDVNTLIFKEGSFDSTACRRYGFVLAPYTTKKAGNAIGFTAVATSKKHGQNQWAGSVAGDKITGTMVWTKGKKSANYTFTGALSK